MERLALAFALAVLLPCSTASAQATSPRNIGPFTLGQTRAQFDAAAKKAGLAGPRLQVPQERDLMGLGLMTVQPITTEAKLAQPEPGRIWQVTALQLGDRIAYLTVDYGLEDTRRRDAWHETYNAPTNARKSLVDGAWSQGGIVLYTDRWGVALHGVDWEGLSRSSRATVSLEGAINNANEFFRRLYARQAEASVEHIRQQVQAWFQRRDGQGHLVCTPPATVALTPGPTACDEPEKRFPTAHASWRQPTWQALGVKPDALSRHYSYAIESSGTYAATRLTILARGDLDCDGTAATLRVTIGADSRSSEKDCLMSAGDWEVINPFD